MSRFSRKSSWFCSSCLRCCTPSSNVFSYSSDVGLLPEMDAIASRGLPEKLLPYTRLLSLINRSLWGCLTCLCGFFPSPRFLLNSESFAFTTPKWFARSW
jgi:hypothetical protein